MSTLVVNSSPHFGTKQKTQNIMLDVIIALSPLIVCSVIFFGYQAIITTVLAVVACVAGEYLYNIIASKFKNFEPGSIKDLSAVVTGIILALNLPANVKWYAPVLGGLFAIMVIKMLFGGIGKNIINPALAGRAFLFLSFGAAMTGSWIVAGAGFNTTVTTGATALSDGGILGSAFTTGLSVTDTMKAQGITMLDMFLGKMGGAMGETSVLALLLGFGYLVVRKVIDWKGPVIMIASAAIFTFLFSIFSYNGIEGFSGDAVSLALDALLPSLMAGGLLFGAIFMATDYATSPNTMWGNVIFFGGCGFLTVLFRFYAGMPEGASFAILFMNMLTPIIDKYVVPKPFGYVKPVKTVKEAK